jgi:hypothetical protein
MGATLGVPIVESAQPGHNGLKVLTRLVRLSAPRNRRARVALARFLRGLSVLGSPFHDAAPGHAFDDQLETTKGRKL